MRRGDALTMISIFDSSTTPSEPRLASHVLDAVVGGGVVCGIRNEATHGITGSRGPGKIPLECGVRGKDPLNGLESGYGLAVTVEE